MLGDRSLITLSLTAARLLREGGRRPAADVYFVFTTSEEVVGNADHLCALGRELGVPPTPAVSSSSESDASRSKPSGQSAQAALLCLPTLSTHGDGLVHTRAIGNCARLLVASLQRPTP